MTGDVLRVQGVGKCYATYTSNLSRFAKWFGLSGRPATEFWASRNISFDLKAGQAVALIGQNGAGKSTLLKLITGTVRPSEGKIEVGGHVSAILELGLGFNAELTGRENVYNSGGMLGYRHHELAEFMPSIEEFAEIDEYFDKPVRTYSSGMQARLAFALATASRPDLLIVDEVLSVGDSYFQHKSFNRIREFKAAGTAILVVTHSMGDVREICDRVLLIENGEVLRDGLPDEVIDYYNALIASRTNANLTIEQKRADNGWLVSRSGTGEANIAQISLHDAETEELISTARVNQALRLRIEIDVNEPIPRLVLGVMIRDRTGHVVWGTNTWHTGQTEEDLVAGEKLVFEVVFDCALGPGSYSISPALVSSSTHLDDNFEWSDNLLVFDVVNFDQTFFLGTSSLNANFNVQRSQLKP